MANEKPDKKNYKQTLNLPQTAFPMEAKLVQNEPARLRTWQESRLYERIMSARADGKKWILHDGPPFANGDIHIGHLINKTLKDVVLRVRTMQGFHSPYVPGWDCHGLPIEHKIQQELGPKFRQMSPTDVRKACHAYAQKYIEIQREQFKRLGIFGYWDCPYTTMSPLYEASQLEVFAKFVEAGLVFKKLRPVPWSTTNQTALAEHELEYKDVSDPSIFVEFAAADAGDARAKLGTDGEPVNFLVWTTTPWTLPANLAIAVNPEVQYAIVRYNRNGGPKLGVVAEDLVKRVFEGRRGVERHEVIKTLSGKDLLEAELEYAHPFIERRGRILPAMYVTTTDGTGLVHTAPGHGVEDYTIGQAAGLPPYSPVLGNGRYDETVPAWLRGLTVWEANPIIVKRLAESGALFDTETITHSYPHDWRSKTPVIQRAAEQWFVAVDKPYVASGEPAETQPKSMRQRALQAVHETRFIPEWGAHRLRGMLEGRPDWSISRQRFWGLPIPVFYNPAGDVLLTPESVRAVAKHFRERGSDTWLALSPAELLGADFVYPPGFKPDELRKEQDTFDVGLDSGTSWHAVLHDCTELSFPSDLYLEGSDQHRLWFQLSLLASLGVTGRAPFRQILTHGFAVKPDGTKVSKSDKEYVTVTQEIERHGADLLRLWCCSVDYQSDIPASPKVIQEFGDKYRKIRNTLRYLLSNLYDFDPKQHAQDVPPRSLDGWAIAELDTLIRDTTAAYDNYQFHRAFRLLHDFCAVQISAIYGNAMKDRLYCELPDAPLRRRAQTVMHRMVLALSKLLAPMIPFTADEAWEHIQHRPGDESTMPSIHLATFPEAAAAVDEAQAEEWKLLMMLRDDALGQLDALKKNAGLNKSLDAEVVYEVDDDDLRRRLQEYGVDLADLVGAGHHTFAEKGAEGPAVRVKVLDRRERYAACARSWKRRPDVGSDPDYPDLTTRDAAAVKALALTPSPSGRGPE
ncbi:MAG TPA: isoleucine--tRNA ligase [Tepidisphaeraceae bacterium]|nr:isoleucine--tRNA ligase [Tepidisphaeraceae bacterium]